MLAGHKTVKKSSDCCGTVSAKSMKKRVGFDEDAGCHWPM